MAEYGILGPLAARVDGQPVDLGGARSRAVLAVLLLGRNTVVSVDRLVDAVWGDDPPPTAEAAVQNHVSRLRRLLGADAIGTMAPGYVLHTAAGDVDIERFEALVERAWAAKPGEAGLLLRDALGLWRGPALADLADEPFAGVEIARLEELRLGALEARIEANLATGRHEALAGELEALVAQHPYRERLHGQRILALYRSGRQAEALAAYQAARTALDEGLGIDPGPDLQALEVRILRQDPTLAAPPTATRPEAMPSDSAERDPLIGRTRELAAVEVALGEARLVTVTGLGGTGKTRLAIAAAGHLRSPTVPARFVDLAIVTDAIDVPAAIAAAIGVGDSADVDLQTAVATALARNPTLLVLDNLEHVLDSGRFIAALLDAAPQLRVLATSRVRLGLREEREFPLDPLALPDSATAVETSDAGRLFLRRARERGTLGELGPGDAEAVVEICRRMDGLPLALELAAAWTRVLSPRAIVRRLEEGRLALTADHDTRHASLERVVVSTMELIHPDHREAFESLSLFIGGLDEPGARAVTGLADPLPTLRRLETVALVRATTQPDGEPRFVMLETIRATGAHRLAERADADAVRRRFAAYFAAAAQVAADALRDVRPGEALVWMARESGNLRAAFDDAVAMQDAPLAVQLAMTMATYGVRSGSARRSLDRLRTALAVGPVPPEIRSEALCAVVNLSAMLAEHDDFAALGREAVHLARDAGDRRRETRAMIALASLGRLPDAEQMLEQAASLAIEIGYTWAATAALDNLGSLAYNDGRWTEAMEFIDRSLQLANDAGDADAGSHALANLAEIHLSLGDVPLALNAAARAVELLRVTWPESSALAGALGTKAAAEALGGRGTEARADLAEAIGVALATESEVAIADVLGSAVTVLAAEQPVVAARALGCRDRLVLSAGQVSTSRPILERGLETLRAAIGPERVDMERQIGADVGAKACLAQVWTAVAAV